MFLKAFGTTVTCCPCFQNYQRKDASVISGGENSATQLLWKLFFSFIISISFLKARL